MGGTEQRMIALALANEVRMARKAWRRWANRVGKVRAMHELASLVAETPEWARTWPVERALRAVPQVGEVAARKVARRVGITAGKRLGDLTSAQRDGLAAILDFTADRWARETRAA